ncbi:MAG: hypothetical protein M3020_13165, partial [Myxococcota bacterium]|nr:hypothetical protein [Myxococcota bacterium]
REAAKMRASVQKLLAKHRAQDEAGANDDPMQRAREARRIERLERLPISVGLRPCRVTRGG